MQNNRIWPKIYSSTKHFNNPRRGEVVSTWDNYQLIRHLSLAGLQSTVGLEEPCAGRAAACTLPDLHVLC